MRSSDAKGTGVPVQGHEHGAGCVALGIGSARTRKVPGRVQRGLCRFRVVGRRTVCDHNVGQCGGAPASGGWRPPASLRFPTSWAHTPFFEPPRRKPYARPASTCNVGAQLYPIHHPATAPPSAPIRASRRYSWPSATPCRLTSQRVPSAQAMAHAASRRAASCHAAVPTR